MEYVQRVDFAKIDAADKRFTQALLARSDEYAGCTVNCIKTPAGEGSPAGLHTHPVDQLFYVMSGVMSLEIAGRQYEAGPGTLVVFPKGVPHRNWNAGTEPTVHLAIQIPAPDPNIPFSVTVG
ncbi:MAG TPA: cupin domain-containing protein [Chloroflexota bacterium]|jgi:mannose-6-phosphate isomerase-like protein (cupin superfamily)|nr:cupin domain-containing protein [Chloroflexota bacterium]